MEVSEMTWNRVQFEAEFSLVGYCEPDLVVVRRRIDGLLGTLWYASNMDGWPRTYYGWRPAN